MTTFRLNRVSAGEFWKEKTGELTAGPVASIPATIPHGFQSTGDETLGCLGIFLDSNVVSIVEYALQPFGTRVVECNAMRPVEA